jgi:CheY-like chemotaxis protein
MLDRLIGEDVHLTRRIEPGLGRIWGDPGELQQVVLNLVINARDAMPSGGSLAIRLRHVDAEQEIAVEGGRLAHGAYIVLEVEDTGIGMDEEVRRRIFEPFFTTKEPGRGTGLGLSTVHAIVQRSRGGIAVESRVGQGTTFRVYLVRVEAPDDAAAAGRAEELAAASPAAGRSSRSPGGTVLLVEDDEMFRGLLVQVLASQGHKVLPAANPAAARELAAANEGAVQLLLSDMIMPGGTGADLARELSGRHPALKVILMSGYTDDALTSREVDGTVADAFLEKPFASQDLLRLIDKLLTS